MLTLFYPQVHGMGGAQSSKRTEGVKTHVGLADRLDSPR